MFIEMTPPTPVFATCEVRRDFYADDPRPCYFMQNEGAIGFSMEETTFLFAGPRNKDEIKVILFQINKEEPVRVSGKCVQDTRARRVTCQWRMESEFTLEARY